MATQDDYSAVANALVRFFTNEAHTLPQFEQNFIPMEKIPAAAGATAKVAVDALDAHRAAQKALDLDFPEIPPIAQGKIIDLNEDEINGLLSAIRIALSVLERREPYAAKDMLEALQIKLMAAKDKAA